MPLSNWRGVSSLNLSGNLAVLVDFMCHWLMPTTPFCLSAQTVLYIRTSASSHWGKPNTSTYFLGVVTSNVHVSHLRMVQCKYLPRGSWMLGYVSRIDNNFINCVLIVLGCNKNSNKPAPWINSLIFLFNCIVTREGGWGRGCRWDRDSRMWLWGPF